MLSLLEQETKEKIDVQISDIDLKQLIEENKVLKEELRSEIA